jgi:methylisocitrate lyase
MAEIISRAGRLRELVAKGIVAMPGVPNASMARQVERAGFDAVYISGAGLANCTAGLPDVGLLTLNEVATLAGFIAKAVKIPAIVDADTGFGGAENVGRTIYELERAGLAGCHLEDQEFPKRCGHLAGKRLVSADEMTAKIRAAVAAKRDRDFLVIARTDSRAMENFDGAVQRANAYVAAGADAIFPEALQTKEEFRDFAREVQVPLLANMTEFGKSPSLSVSELGELGYKMVIFPQSAFRVSMKTTQEFFAALKKAGKPDEWLDRMQTRKELYETLDYDPSAESWPGYDVAR